MLKQITFGAFVALSFAASAQIVRPIDLSLDSTMYAPNGVVQGCGVGFWSFLDGGAGSFDMLNGSITVNSPGFALVKIGLLSGKMKDGEPNLMPTKAKIDWLKVAELPTLLPTLPGVREADTSGYQLYATDFKVAADGIFEIVAGKRIWAQFKLPNGSSVVLSGKSPANKEVDLQLRACFIELARAMGNETQERK